MSNGYLLAAEADVSTAREIGEGFGLEVASAGTLNQSAIAPLAEAPNVGLILSLAAAQDEAFVALLRGLAQVLQRAQLILVEPEARAAFAFLPEAWPVMSIEEARARALALTRDREPPQEETPPAAPPAPPIDDERVQEQAAQELEDVGSPTEDFGDAPAEVEAAPAERSPVIVEEKSSADVLAGGAAEPPPPTEDLTLAPEPQAPPAELDGQRDEPVSAAPEPEEPVIVSAPVPMAPARKRDVDSDDLRSATRSGPAPSSAASSAPADATAFAPKKLRRSSPELVRIAIHQPKDLQAVIKAARKIDPGAVPAPQSMPIGEVALGASVGVSLEVRGGACNGALQRRVWTGEAIDFSFSIEADPDVKQAVLLARVFVDDAQIGVLAFTRQVTGAKPRAASDGERVRLKRHKRVFISYSNKDREVVAAIAVAYEKAGVPYFWDRTSLKSGEEWSPRLRREIDRADLFHLCWSKSAAASEWVEKEAEHALTRRRRTGGKRPEITVQMLDGPPWAPHPLHLDSIQFDDFVRAAIVGYARGEG
jgi:hypothetical protein